MKKIVLASSSPRRKELLAKTGLKFIVCPSDYEEDMTLDVSPAELAKILSQGKAESVAERYKNAVIIGVDTFVVYEDNRLGKPRTRAEAVKMLKILNEKTHAVISGFTIIDAKTGKRRSQIIKSKVHFRKMSDEEIAAYVKTGEPMGKSGAYAIQGRASVFIKKVDGDFYNVMGFPIFAIMNELRKFGIDPFPVPKREKS